MKPAFLFIAVAAILRAQTFTEYPVPSASSQPYAITVGPDGALWFTETNGAKIGRITTSGVVTEFPLPAGSQPLDIIAGPDGALWFGDSGSPGLMIGRITTSGAITQFPVPLTVQVGKLTAGPDGALWFTVPAAQIGRVTTSGVQTYYHLPSTSGSAASIVTASDGNMWFGDTNTAHLDRITPSGVITQFAMPAGQSAPNDLAIGPDGAVWGYNNSSIFSINTSGSSAGTIGASYPAANSAVQSLTSGPDGALWYIDWQANKVGRITLSGIANEYLVPTSSAEPWSIVAGPDGAMWFTERNSSGGPPKIGRITVPPVSTGPTILAGGIVNAASYAQVNGAGSPVAPGSLVAIFTSQLPGAQAANFTTANLPPSLGNVSVTFNSVTSPMVAVSPTGQYPYVSAQVPFEALGPGQSSATVPVVITVNNIPSPTVQASIVASQPGIFTIPATGQGNAILTFLNPQTNAPAIAAPPGSGITYPTAPIPRGTGGFFYVTGLGAMMPAVPDGSGTCPSPDGICNANATPIVMVGGITAHVAFAGQAPGFPGVFQVNITIPQGAPTGSNVPLVVMSADRSVTSNTATIAVQ